MSLAPSCHVHAFAVQIDIGRFLKQHLIPHLEKVYEKASQGLFDDHFLTMEKELRPLYPFLFEGNARTWDMFLTNTIKFLQDTRTRFRLRYTMQTLPSGHRIPTVTIYELLKSQKKTIPIKKFSEFWKIDFSNVIADTTTFTVEYARPPLLVRYDLWLQQKGHLLQLEGITYPEPQEIVLFVNTSSSLENEQALFHEFSHILFDLKTHHLSSFELEHARIVVQQNFPGRSFPEVATTEVEFTYQEFNELMAKLSELMVVPDTKLHAFINEVEINPVTHYQATRMLIATTTVYKYMSDVYPERFEELKVREITDDEVNHYLQEMAHTKGFDGRSILREYLLQHVKMLQEKLRDTVFLEQ